MNIKSFLRSVFLCLLLSSVFSSDLLAQIHETGSSLLRTDFSARSVGMAGAGSVNYECFPGFKNPAGNGLVAMDRNFWGSYIDGLDDFPSFDEDNTLELWGSGLGYSFNQKNGNNRLFNNVSLGFSYYNMRSRRSKYYTTDFKADSYSFGLGTRFYVDMALGLGIQKTSILFYDYINDGRFGDIYGDGTVYNIGALVKIPVHDLLTAPRQDSSYYKINYALTLSALFTGIGNIKYDDGYVRDYKRFNNFGVKADFAYSKDRTIPFDIVSVSALYAYDYYPSAGLHLNRLGAEVGLYSTYFIRAGIVRRHQHYSSGLMSCCYLDDYDTSTGKQSSVMNSSMTAYYFNPYFEYSSNNWGLGFNVTGFIRNIIMHKIDEKPKGFWGTLISRLNIEANYTRVEEADEGIIEYELFDISISY